MSRQLITNASLVQLRSYVLYSWQSYNRTSVIFQTNGIFPQEDVPHASSRKKDIYLDTHLLPLRLDDSGDVGKLMSFVEQLLGVHTNSCDTSPQAEALLRSLERDGWRLVGSRIVRVGLGVDDLIAEMFIGHPAETIQREWDRALQSLESDPADALTASSSMLEATYKFILHELHTPLPGNQDVQRLAAAVHSGLSLTPEQATDQDFKRCLGGLLNVALGLGAIRTKIGDAHGAAVGRKDPLARHARLAVNSAGTLCLFLLETVIDQVGHLNDTN